MNLLYLGIVLAYFLIILLVGTFLRGAAKTSDSFLIAGRSMGIVLCTATIAGEWLGGMSTIGTSELAMTSGFFPMWYNISTAVGMMIFGFTVASIYRRNQVHTVGEMLEKLYNRQTRTIASVCFVAAFMILSYLQLQAVGSVMSEMLGIEYWVGILIAGILITAYVIRGGIESIAATNLLHVGLMYITLLTAYIIAMIKLGGYSGLFSQLETVTDIETVQRFRNPFSSGLAPIAAWLLGGILSGFASQASIQPVFAARDVRTAKWSAVLSGLIIAPLGVIVATLGMVRRSEFFGGGELSSLKQALPNLLMNPDFIPPWVGALGIAGILAAILSTVGPVMFAISTILTKDIYHRLIREDATDQQVLRMSRMLTIAVGLAVTPMAILLKGAILDAAYVTYAIRASAAIAVLFGIFWMKGNIPVPTPKAAVTALISSTAASVVFMIFRTQITAVLGFTVDKVYAALFFALISILIVTPFTRDDNRGGGIVRDGGTEGLRD
jgi:solute:Na+ symporter, SSS family